MTLWAPNFNGAEIMKAGMALVPDLAGQQVQRRNQELQAEALQLQKMQEDRLLTEAGRKFERQQQFQTEIASFRSNPTPGGIVSLMTAYPEMSEGLKRAWDAQSEEKKAADMGQLGEAYSYIENGNIERAKAVLRRRVEAERAAGLEPEEAGLLEELEGGDPEAVAGVKAQLMTALAVAAGPDKFASAYGALNPDKSALEKESRYIASVDGDDAAKSYRQNRIDPLVTITNADGTTMAPRSFLERTYGSASRTPGIGDGQRAEREGDSASVTADVAAMIPITLQSESNGKRYGRSGALTTSPKGAKGEMQVMPGTITDPGYGVRAAQNNTPDEIARVGRDYLGAMMKRYGNDPAKAWAAYNWGPDNLDKALDRHGGNWRKHLPAETRRYVNKNLAALKKGPEPTKAPARVMTRQQFAKLPSGTEFIAPDGTRRRKP